MCYFVVTYDESDVWIGDIACLQVLFMQCEYLLLNVEANYAAANDEKLTEHEESGWTYLNT